MDLTEKQIVKELMIKYGFTAPDMTVTEFVEDILPSAKPKTVCVAKIILSDEQIQEAVEKVKNEVVQVLPSAQPEPCLDSIVSEIKKTISEMKENGKYHCDNIRINGEMICCGLQLALEIIKEKRNEQFDKQAGGD